MHPHDRFWLILLCVFMVCVTSCSAADDVAKAMNQCTGDTRGDE